MVYRILQKEIMKSRILNNLFLLIRLNMEGVPNETRKDMDEMRKIQFWTVM